MCVCVWGGGGVKSRVVGILYDTMILHILISYGIFHIFWKIPSCLASAVLNGWWMGFHLAPVLLIFVCSPTKSSWDKIDAILMIVLNYFIVQ